MTSTGIGAPVRRKEDLRFITGKGQYTDDINRPGQAHAYFVRSPHAHATIKSHRRHRRPGDAGRARRADRRRPRRRQGGRPDLRLDDPLQGRLADEGRRPPGAGAGQGALCRRPRRRRHRRGLRHRPRRGREGRRRLRRAAGRRRHGPGRDRARPPFTTSRPTTGSIDWHLGDKAATDAAFAKAKHVTKLDIVNNRLVPNAMEPRAAIGDYDAGQDAVHALHDEPEPARRAPRAVGLHRHRARAQAARHRARRRRRLRLQDLHLRRRDRLRLGRQEGRPSGEVDRRPHRGVPLPTRMAATTSPTPRWRSTRRARSSACA